MLTHTGALTHYTARRMTSSYVAIGIGIYGHSLLVDCCFVVCCCIVLILSFYSLLFRFTRVRHGRSYGRAASVAWYHATVLSFCVCWLLFSGLLLHCAHLIFLFLCADSPAYDMVACTVMASMQLYCVLLLVGCCFVGCITDPSSSSLDLLLTACCIVIVEVR